MTHATLREIEEQPAAIDAVISELRDRESELLDVVSESTSFCLTGCGTSYYLASSGSALLDQVASSTAIPGGEVLVSPDQLPDDGIDCIVSVSRSGESTETVRATEELRERYPDATVIGVTCTEGSPLYEAADVPILSPAGAEESVVMTKSYSSMLVVFEYLGGLIENGPDPLDGLDALPDASQRVVERADDVAEKLGSNGEFEKLAFLGTGEYYGLASEAMLKMEEMTLSWTKAYHPLEFRHGPKSIVDEDTLVTLLLPERALDLHADLVDDVRDLGATTLVVGTESALDRVDADETVRVPDDGPSSLALYAPAFQLLAYYRAVELGLNPDEPQNLTQVVTL